MAHEFPAFLEAFQPVQNIGYLPDVARLERALRQSYHAADAASIDPAVLQAMTPDRLMASRLQLAPAVRLVRSQWPVYAIWLANTAIDAPKPQMKAEDVLVTRPSFDPKPQVLGPGAGAFIAATGKGETFAAAIEAAGENFDLTALLGQLLAGGAITGYFRRNIE